MNKKITKGLSLAFACLLGVGGLVGAIHASNNAEVQQVQAASEYEIHFWPVNQGSGGIGEEGIWHWGGSYVRVPETSKIKINSGSAMMPSSFYFTILDEDLNSNNIKSFEFNIKLHADMTLRVKRGYDDIFFEQDITADNTWVKVGKTAITGTGNFNFNIENKKGSVSDEIYFETPNLKVYSVVEYPVYISQGTGVSNVYLSTSSSATSGSSSGTNFEDGKTVYAFATLANGYSAPSGWSKVSGSTYRIGSKKISGGSYDFGTASASATKYTISYTLNGGSVSGTNPTEYYVTTSDFTLINPTKTGYTFNGWSGTGISGTSTSVKVSKGSTGDRSYTANFTANTYTVRFNANKPSNASGTVTNLPGNATWTYDSNATLPAAPVLPGWTFGGWYKEAACTNKLGNAGQTLTKPNLRTTSGNYDLYAKWTANTYSAVYNGNKPAKAPESYEVTNIPSSETWTYDSTSQVTLGSAPSLTGYDFDGWYKDAECTNKLGNAGQTLSKPNLTTVNGGTANIYAKWVLNAEIQAVINEIVKTKSVTYEELTDQIEIADEAYNNLALEFQPVVDSEGYTQILNNAKAADEVGQMIEDLGPAQDSEAWREEVAAVRAAYNDLVDKSYIPSATILKILEEDEAAIVVMDAINDIGETRWTSASKEKIDDAQDAYNSYIALGYQHEQVANYGVLVQAHTDYDNVQTFVDKVNAITLNPFEYSDACKALIDEARRYFEEDLSGYQKGLVNSDAISYYNLLVNYENAYHAMYLIDQINDMEDDPSCGEKIEAARNAIEALNPTTELPLVNATLMKELTDKEAAWGVMGLINDIYPMVYGEACEQAIQTARDAYTALTSDQKPLVANYAELTKAEADYIAVKAVVVEVNNLGDIRHDEASLAKIESARNNYEALTEDQKDLYPEASLQVIVDYETAYESLDKIYDIGVVTYTHESENLIDEARSFYNNLTEDQKALVHEDDLAVLIKAETEYGQMKKTATIWIIIALCLVCLSILGGLWFLFFLLKKRRKDDDEDEQKGKKAPVKALSVTGLLPLMMLSHYIDAPWIALYVLAGLSICLWIAILVIFLVKKHNKASQDDEEVVTVIDEKGNKFQIRYVKSFQAKLIQSSEESKKYYEELKNEVLAYKGTSSRVSWNYDSINAGKNQVLKFGVRGKTLCVYLPLNVEEVDQNKYKVEKVESKKYEKVSCMYRIKNDRRVNYAKLLIARVARKLHLEKGEEQHEKYANLPYEENKPLIARGLIKELKVQLNKAPEVEILEKKVNADGDEIIVEKDEQGNIFELRYIKSFTAKASQAEETVKDYYNELKNYALAYEEVNSRISWHYEAFSINKDIILKMAIRGKTLCLFFALDMNEVDSKYKVEEAKGKRFSDVKCLYRIKNDRRVNYAKELIDLLMKKNNLTKGALKEKDFRIPFEETKALLEKGLIKEVKRKLGRKVIEEVQLHSITVEKADEMMSDEVAEEKIEVDTIHHHQKGKKEIVNIDVLSKHYNDDEEVTLESLKEKKLVSNQCGYVKVLARGILNKRLIVDLDDYSLQAVKMIVLLGGHAKKIK